MKKILLYFLISLLFFAVSCGKTASGRGVSEQSESKSFSVTDSRGETVELPGEIKSIAAFPAPLPHIIVYLDGNAKRIKGLHPLAKKAAEVSVLSRIAPSLLEAEDNFLTGSLLNTEELLKIKPDVFFTDQVLQGMEKLKESGLPVIYLGLEKDRMIYRDKEIEFYSPEKSIRGWVDITASVLGSEKKKAGAIFEEWESVKKEIAEKTASIPDEKKKKILIVFKASGNMVAGGNSFGQYWIASTGGINCADEVTANHPAMVKIADFEQVLKWNPDIVYLTNFAETMPEDIYSNAIQGQDWSGTSAYKNRTVYKIPLGNYRWYPPSLDGPLMLKWMAVKNYPDLFNWDMDREIREYYKKYFNYALTDVEIHNILNPAGSGIF